MAFYPVPAVARAEQPRPTSNGEFAVVFQFTVNHDSINAASGRPALAMPAFFLTALLAIKNALHFASLASRCARRGCSHPLRFWLLAVLMPSGLLVPMMAHALSAGQTRGPQSFGAGPTDSSYPGSPPGAHALLSALTSWAPTLLNE